MASPQKENGYTPIAHEIIEALCRAGLSGVEWACVMLILRESYGRHSKIAKISFSDFTRRTGHSRRHIIRALRKLRKARISEPPPSDVDVTTLQNAYIFQKDYHKWAGFKRMPLVTPASLGGGDARVTGGSDAGVTSTNKVVVKDKEKDKHTYSAKGIPQPSAARVRFESVWHTYPVRKGRKLAERSFHATVKTDEDLASIKAALRNYLASATVARGFIQNGSTWFNNWQDWVKPSPEMMNNGKVAEKELSWMHQ